MLNRLKVCLVKKNDIKEYVVIFILLWKSIVDPL